MAERVRPKHYKKYSDDDVREWLELSALGLSYKQIAKIFNTTSYVIYYQLKKNKQA